MNQINNLAELETLVGQLLGKSDWVEISQEMIHDFAKATGDYQWIHLDAEKAAKYSPFKTTIAHGFLTLSLASKFMGDIFQVNSAKMSVNYGTNKVRFMSPVPSGSRVRMSCTLKDLKPQAPNGVQIVTECVFEIEGATKPACAAELVSLIFE